MTCVDPFKEHRELASIDLDARNAAIGCTYTAKRSLLESLSRNRSTTGWVHL
jgi:hypothetical protein